MIKVVQQSSWGSLDQVEVNFINDSQGLKKIASTIFGMDYEDLKPDKNHVGIHLVALGDYEHFGLNRNYDGFSKESCLKYGNTFVTHGHIYEHHRNNDPSKALGTIKKSAYNPAMGRQELFIHVDKDRGAEHLSKFEKEGSAAFSMACNVLYDTCNVCNAVRKSRSDDTTCDHLRYQFGKQAEDGTIIGTMNPEPTWFDISFVTKPADRIAWDLKKVASSDISDAEYRKWTWSLQQGMTLPSHIAIDTDPVRAKLACLQRLASVEDDVINKSRFNKYDQNYLEMIKSACSSRYISDKDIDNLRSYDPKDVFYKLASQGVILTPSEFYRYIFGNKVTNKVAHAIDRCSTIVKECNDNPVEVCTNTRYDVDMFKSASTVGVDTDHLSITGNTFRGMLLLGNSGHSNKVLDKSASYGIEYRNEIDILAKEYVAYKVAALAHIEKGKSEAELRNIYTVAATQNLFK